MSRIVGEPISEHLKIYFTDSPPLVYEIAVRPYIEVGLHDFSSEEHYKNLKDRTRVIRLVYEYKEQISYNWYLYRFAGAK